MEIFSFLAFFVGLFLATELTIPVANGFFGSNGYFQVVVIGVFVSLFLIATILVNLIAKILKKAFQLAMLGTLDQILGTVVGMTKWAFIVSMFFWFFGSVGIHVPKEMEGSSIIFPYIAGFGEWLGGALPFAKDMIDSLKDIGEKGKTMYT